MRVVWGRGALVDYRRSALSRSKISRPSRSSTRRPTARGGQVASGGGADRARGVGGLNFGFSENGRAKIGADAKELKPEALRFDGKNAFELVHWISLEKTEVSGRAQPLVAARVVDAALCPRIGVAPLARALRDQARHLGPVGGGLRRLRLAVGVDALPNRRGAGTRRSTDWRRPRAFRRFRPRPPAGAPLWAASSADGYRE